MDDKQSKEESFKQKAQRQTIGYMTAALGLVAGLAWNDAVKTLIESVYPAQGNSVAAKFVYAIVITLLIVVVSTYLLKFSNRKNQS